MRAPGTTTDDAPLGKLHASSQGWETVGPGSGDESKWNAARMRVKRPPSTGNEGDSSQSNVTTTSPPNNGVLFPVLSDFRSSTWPENFIPLAQWEGRVLEVAEKYYVAAVVDQTDRNALEEEAEIPLDEVSPVDRDLVQPGALFFWTIGYRVQASGQQSRESSIRFRRLPRWSIEDVEHARRRVASSGLRVESAEDLDPTKCS